MKTILVGLGGSGISVVLNLQKILRDKLDGVSDEEQNELKERFGEVKSIVIDTDKRDLNKAADAGIKAIRISSSGKVEDYINALGGDVTDWCPYSENESVFLSSGVDDGASMCRFKSRLCLAGYLKNENNDLEKALESLVTANGKIDEENIRIMIISSIAGGTGSGIFIQVALYIKRFFKKLHSQIHITGLFSCPDLYRDLVDRDEVPHIYANAYAVIRELNALNLVYSNSATSDYGKNTNIKISSECEGKLFSSDMNGNYDYKPYDTLYFIDKYTEMGTITAAKKHEFYEKMANIVYAQMFSPISSDVMHSQTSNEMQCQNEAPLAIYASSGCANMKYPYKEILMYVSARLARESISDIWLHFDKKWEDHVNARRADVAATGYRGRAYKPTDDDRRKFFISEFRDTVFGNPFEEQTKMFELLKNGLEDVKDKNSVPRAVNNYISSTITTMAEKLYYGDSIIHDEERMLGLTSEAITKKSTSVANTVLGNTGKDKKVSIISDDNDGSVSENAFLGLVTLCANMNQYADTCISRIPDLSLQMANRMLCVNETIWDNFEKNEGSIVRHILRNEKNGDKYVHPLTIRYLLYCLKDVVNSKVQDKGENKTDMQRINSCNKMIKDLLHEKQMLMLDANPKDKDDHPVDEVLAEKAKKFFGGKKNVGKFLTRTDEKGFIGKTITNKNQVDRSIIKTIEKIALSKFSKHLDELIKSYETFFDNMPKCLTALDSKIAALSEIKSEDGSIVYYTGCSTKSNDEIYKKVSGVFNIESDDTTSIISESIYKSIRDTTWSTRKEGKSSAGFSEKLLETVYTSIEKEQEVARMIDKDIFTAMLDKYESKNGTFDLVHFKQNSESRNNVIRFITSEMKELVIRAQPSLIYDTADRSLNDDKTRVNLSYRYLQISEEAAETIKNLYGMESANDAVNKLCDDILGEMPLDRERQTTEIHCIITKAESKRNLFCFSTARLLQPFQINHFDELRNGDYYINYEDRIMKMLRYNKYSLSPHLDKTWHQRGKMPYINKEKESESRRRIIKALIYALLYSKIQLTENGGVKYYVMNDPTLARDGISPLILRYKGSIIREGNYAPLIYCIESREDICNRYSERLEKNIADAISRITDNYDYDISRLESDMTKNNIIKFLRTEMITSASNEMLNGATRTTTVRKAGALNLAIGLRKSEERPGNIDYDSAELLLETIAEIITKFCRACFSESQLKENDDVMFQFSHMKQQQAAKFMQAYIENLGEKAEVEDVKVETDETKSESEAEADVSTPDNEKSEEKTGEPQKDDKPAADNGKPKKVAKGAKGSVPAKPALTKRLEDVTENPSASSSIPARSVMIKASDKILNSSDYKWLEANFLNKLM